MTYLVIQDADTDPVEFTDYADAVACVNELADELETDGYSADRSWASQDNLYAVHAVAPDLTRTIQVVIDQ